MDDRFDPHLVACHAVPPPRFEPGNGRSYGGHVPTLSVMGTLQMKD